MARWPRRHWLLTQDRLGVSRDQDRAVSTEVFQTATSETPKVVVLDAPATAGTGPPQ